MWRQEIFSCRKLRYEFESFCNQISRQKYVLNNFVFIYNCNIDGVQLTLVTHRKVIWKSNFLDFPLSTLSIFPQFSLPVEREIEFQYFQWWRGNSLPRQLKASYLCLTLLLIYSRAQTHFRWFVGIEKKSWKKDSQEKLDYYEVIKFMMMGAHNISLDSDKNVFPKIEHNDKEVCE